MKRALSLLLCVAMLMSMAVISTSADDGAVWDASLVPEDKRNTEITFTLDKESYKPGDVVAITATIDSMWGDLSIEGRMPGYDAGMDIPGMYGVGCLQTCLIFDPSVFKMSKAITTYAKTTITNADVATIDVTTPILANQLWANGNGYLSVMMQAGSDNSEGTGYAALGGSGKFFTAYLKIADDVASGSYNIITGAYTVADNNTPGFETTDVFFGAEYARMDNCFNYNTEDIEVKYNMPAIVIEGGSQSGSGEPEPEPEPMEITLTVPDTTFVKDDIVNVDLVVKNNEGITADIIASTFSFDNTALELVSVTTPVEDFSIAPIDFDRVNALGSFENLGTPVSFKCDTDGENTYSADGILISLQFKVLGTAQGGETAVSGTSVIGATYNDAKVKIAGDHVHEFEDIVTAPTCTEKGYTDKVCSCGLTYEKVSVEDAKGHVESTDPKDTITVPATCVLDGHTVILCSDCGKNAKSITIPALGHDWEESDVAANCTQDGYHLKACKREGCGVTEQSNFVAKLEHKYPDGSDAFGEPFVHIKPTTNSLGYMGKECALCKSIEDFESIPMLDILKGDADMDGEITVSDVIIILKYIAGWKDLYFSKENADTTVDKFDINGNVIININTLDAVRILKYLAGWKEADGSPISLNYTPTKF